MQTASLSVLTATVGSIWLLTGWATVRATAATTPAAPARITVLYDAFGKDAAMTKDWGYAALVEINGKRILFDTGDDPAIFEKNVKAKGVDLTRLDFVVLSHRHSDHVSGLSYLLKVNPKVKIYAPKDGLGGIFGSDIPSKFYRKDEALPGEMRYYGGTPPEIMKLGTVMPGANIQLIDKTTEVTPGHHADRSHFRYAGHQGTEGAVSGHRHAGRRCARGGLLPSRHRGHRCRGSQDQFAHPLSHWRAPPGYCSGSSHRGGSELAAQHLQSGFHRPGPLHRRADLHRAAEGIR